MWTFTPLSKDRSFSRGGNDDLPPKSLHRGPRMRLIFICLFLNKSVIVELYRFSILLGVISTLLGLYFRPKLSL